jgi:hypothetical protein
MARKRTYKQRIPLTINLESNLREEFEEIARKEGKSLSEKLQEVMLGEIQRKKAIGPENPIGISYNDIEDNKSLDLNNWSKWSKYENY